jgi:hypothetical protein
MRPPYFLLVAFLQLMSVDNPGAAMAQDLNLQTQMNQMAPTPQLPAPDLSVGRTTQPGTRRPEHAQHTVQRKHKKQ